MLTTDIDTCLGAIIALINALGDDSNNQEINTHILQAFASMRQNANIQNNIQTLRQDKDILVPDCKVCAHPCGRTSEVSINLYSENVQKKALDLIEHFDSYSIDTLFTKVIEMLY